MKDSIFMETFNPLVSIIIPVYNGAKYLEEAIDSALNQTYHNIEIIVVNDGSNDERKTDRVAISYGDKIKYFNKQNGGCGSALNFGIQHSSGDYISWLSHDDAYYPEKISRQIELLSSLENKKTIIYGGYELIDEDSRSKGKVQFHIDTPINKLNTLLYPVMRGMVNGCSLLIAKELFYTVGFFREELATTQDYDLWAKFFRKAPVQYIPDILIKTRIHSEQGSHTINTHNDECNDLWIRLIKEVTPDEADSIDGSYCAFLCKSEKFLQATSYQLALSECQKMLTENIGKIKVSVIIPFYNRISETVLAVQSAQVQTHSNIEIIVIDDGSYDDVGPLHKLIEEDSRIKYFRTENRGPAAARNYGIDLASGEYIAFLDSDDSFDPSKIEIQLKYMEDEQVSFSHTSYVQVNSELNSRVIMNSGEFKGLVYPEIIVNCPIATPTVMVKREFMLANRFPETFYIGEDVCIWIDISSTVEVGGINKALTTVNILDQSASQNIEKTMQGVLNIASYLLQNPLHKAYMPDIITLLRSITDPKSSSIINITVDWHAIRLFLLRNKSIALIAEGIKSLRREGFLITLKRIYKRVLNK